MSFTDSRSALFSAFKDNDFFDETVISFENRKFVPPDVGPWAALYFMPTQPVCATLGEGGTDRMDGILQVDLNYPTDAGEAEVNLMFENIRDVFKCGARFAYQNQEVIIKSCGRNTGRIVNNFYKVVVTIQFYTHIIR